MNAATGTRTMRRRVVRVLVVLLMAAIVYSGWTVYHAISVSLQAEENLHATIFAIRLVEQFVVEQGRWPRSWEELEALSVSDDPPAPREGVTGGVLRIGGQHGYDWPAASTTIQQYVTISFSPDLGEIARQDPMAFTAIRPIGPHFEYRDYGFVDSLQTTIRGLLTPVPAPVSCVGFVRQHAG